MTDAACYREGLLEDTLPFWVRHAPDPERGGFFTSLGRDGTVIDTDKAVWAQGRFTWLLATLYSTVEERREWRELALSGLEFLKRHCFADDGRMFFLVTREGQPLRKRRYAYSEAFAAMAFAACARMTERADLAERAIQLYQTFTTAEIPPKVDPGTRPTRGIGALMIRLNVARVLGDCLGFEEANEEIEGAVEEIERLFVKPELRAVLETVGPSGEIIDHFDGRTLNPGHAIEAAWFILHEARVRGEPRWVELGTSMLDGMWERGWDVEHGGLYYYRDLHHGPVQEYWHDMKFWWPHNEAIIATLLAHQLTGDEKYRDWHRQVHDWAHTRFADPAHGEWFGYLHRDGGVSVDLKGNHWKGPFHLPRMQWLCWRMLEAPDSPVSF